MKASYFSAQALGWLGAAANNDHRAHPDPSAALVIIYHYDGRHHCGG